MPTVTILPDGSISVALDPQEQAMAQMLREDKGPQVLTDVFSLWFKREVEGVMNVRFARLTPTEQSDMLTKMRTVRRGQASR